MTQIKLKAPGENRRKSSRSRITLFVASVVVIYLLGYPAIYLGHPIILFQNVPLLDSARFSFSYPFREINFQPERGAQLNALYFPTQATPKRGVVLYFHGNADNLTRWGQYADRFLNRGYDVWMYDYRQYGKSKGAFTEETFYRDAAFMYQQVLKKYPENQIILYGYSLGTGIATQIAADHQPRLLLLEAPYFNLPDVWWQHAPLYPYAQLMLYQFRTNERIGQVNCPIHLFHGTNDGVIPYTSSLKLAHLLNRDPAELITTVDGGAHKNLADFSSYQQALGLWLSRISVP